MIGGDSLLTSSMGLTNRRLSFKLQSDRSFLQDISLKFMYFQLYPSLEY